MAAPSWTYSDWRTYPRTNATRLERLNLHIKEVSDKISEGDDTTEGRSRGFGYLQTYLSELMKLEKDEAAASQVQTGVRPIFTRGRAR